MIIIAIIVYIVALAGGVTGLKAILDRLDPCNTLHFFLAALSFMGLIALAFGGLMGIAVGAL